jgi:hypothetical protein
MAIRNLSVQAMLGISGAWLDPGRERPLIGGIPLLAPFLDELESAHDGLSRMPVKGSDIGAELEDLTRQATSLDELHDRKLRGIYGVLTSFADLADEPGDAARYLDLADRLFPSGLKGVKRSYLDEAGEAALTAKRLTDDMRRTLEALPVPGGTLADEMDAWLNAGETLGDVEQKRVRLGQDKEGKNVSIEDVSKARSRWSRVVNTMLQILDLVPSLEDASRARLLKPLKTAEAEADRERHSATPEAPATP